MSRRGVHLCNLALQNLAKTKLMNKLKAEELKKKGIINISCDSVVKCKLARNKGGSVNSGSLDPVPSGIAENQNQGENYSIQDGCGKASMDPVLPEISVVQNNDRNSRVDDGCLDNTERSDNLELQIVPGTDPVSPEVSVAQNHYETSCVGPGCLDYTKSVTHTVLHESDNCSSTEHSENLEIHTTKKRKLYRESTPEEVEIYNIDNGDSNSTSDIILDSSPASKRMRVQEEDQQSSEEVFETSSSSDVGSFEGKKRNISFKVVNILTFCSPQK